MKLPRVLKVAHVDFKVRTTRAPMNLGEFDGSQGVLYVNTTQADAYRRESLLHEALHAVVSIAGLKDQIDKAEDGLEEEIVARLCPLLLTMLRDNPELVEYLVAE